MEKVTMMATYKPKAGAIEAEQFTAEMAERYSAYHNAPENERKGKPPTLPAGVRLHDQGGFFFTGPGGEQRLSFGDYIVRDSGRVIGQAEFEAVYAPSH